MNETIALITQPTARGVEVTETCLGMCIYKEVVTERGLRRAVRTRQRMPLSAKLMIAASVMREFGEVVRERDALARAAEALAAEIREQGRVGV